MTAAALVQSLGVSLLLTLVLEELFALVWGLRGRDLYLLLLLNLLTNPLAVTGHFLLCQVWDLPRLAVVPVLEGLAVLAEGYGCRTLGQRISHPWRFALSANLFSYGTGVLLQWIF